MTILSIDLGTKSIGICVSDPEEIIPIPVGNFFYESGNIDQAINIIKQSVIDHDVNLVLLGYPLRTDGKKSKMTLFVEDFFKQLKKALNSKIIIKLINEANSTKHGLELIKQKKASLNEQKLIKDVLAAYVILFDYLNLV